MNKICSIAVFYGKFNNYFRLWLKSCEFNPHIDFLIITDIIYDQPIPDNVKFIIMSLDEVRKRITSASGINVSIPSPYKLCDSRPVFGLAFSDFLSQYEYWGHNDLDMLYGDIEKFLVLYKYQEYDKFLPLGHLSFYKNTIEINNLFKCSGSRCGDYKKVLSIGDKVFAFDENIGVNNIFLKNNKKLFFKRIFVDVSNIYERMKISEMAGIDHVYEKNYRNQIFYWEKGHVYRDYFVNGTLNTQEFIYIHLFRRPNFNILFDLDRYSAFYITPYGFVPKEGITTEDIIEKYNPYKSFLFEKAEYARWTMKKIKEKAKYHFK